MRELPATGFQPVDLVAQAVVDPLDRLGEVVLVGLRIGPICPSGTPASASVRILMRDTTAGASYFR